MVETSRTLPHGESELDRIGLRLTEFKGFPLPRLADCRVASTSAPTINRWTWGPIYASTSKSYPFDVNGLD
jgi:hypothetical protein